MMSTLVWLIAPFMIFAVLDPSPLTVCINCSFWATVCKTVRPMLSGRCPVCLSCLCTVPKRLDGSRWNLVCRYRPWPHYVRWRPSFPQRGTVPPIFGPYLLRPNGCMDQDVTWYGARPRPRRLRVRSGPRFPSPKNRPMFTGAKQLDGSRWYLAPHGGRPQPRGLCVRWRPSLPAQKGVEPSNFRPMFIVAKRLDGSGCHLVGM